MRQKILVFLFCLLVLPFASYAQEVTFSTAPLAIKTKDATLNFTVEVATTPEQLRYGLMYRKSLPDMHGMIFVFTPAQDVIFWMKNTPLPLDMLFIDAQGTVAQIAPNARPESTDLIRSKGKMRAVIELLGGSASKLHIAPGDKVVYSLFP